MGTNVVVLVAGVVLVLGGLYVAFHPVKQVGRLRTAECVMSWVVVLAAMAVVGYGVVQLVG